MQERYVEIYLKKINDNHQQCVENTSWNRWSVNKASVFDKSGRRCSTKRVIGLHFNIKMRHPNDFGPQHPPPPPPPPPSGFILLINIINTITHLVLGAVATCAFLFAIVMDLLPINSHLINHVYLCVIGVSEISVLYKLRYYLN